VSNPEKLLNLMSVIRACIEDGRYLDTRHAFERQDERRISRPEILYVLKNGHHEKKKDKFDEFHREWNYAVQGKTVDRRNLRVIVSFDEASGMLIITAIELKK
jgi:Domain of unknown function (DUF4258)